MPKSPLVHFSLVVLLFSVGLRISGGSPLNATTSRPLVTTAINSSSITPSYNITSVPVVFHDANTTNISTAPEDVDCVFVNCGCIGSLSTIIEYGDIICKNVSLPLVRNKELADRKSKITMLDLSSSSLTEVPESVFQNLDINDIDLSDNNFTHLHPGTFRGILRLLGLDMSRNQLSDLDDEFFWPIHSSVIDLKLNLNQLNKMNSTKFGMILTNFTNIQILNLKSNNLFMLPNITGLTKLTDLGLEGNQLDSLLGPNDSYCIPSSVLDLKLENNRIITINNKTFSNLVNLKYLDLSSNQISVISSGAFLALKKLKHLILRKNYLKQIPSQAIYPLANLERLDMSNQNALLKHLDDYAFDRVFNDSALRVDLNGNKISTISPRAFCVRNNSGPYANIQELDLAGNPMSEFKACHAYQLSQGLPKDHSPRIIFKGANNQMLQQEHKLTCDCEVTYASYFVNMIGDCTMHDKSNVKLANYKCDNATAMPDVEVYCHLIDFECPTNHAAIPIKSFEPVEQHADAGYNPELNIAHEKTTSESNLVSDNSVGLKKQFKVGNGATEISQLNNAKGIRGVAPLQLTTSIGMLVVFALYL